MCKPHNPLSINRPAGIKVNAQLNQCERKGNFQSCRSLPACCLAEEGHSGWLLEMRGRTLVMVNQDKWTQDKGSHLYLENKAHLCLREKKGLNFADIPNQPESLRIWALKRNLENLLHTHFIMLYYFYFVYMLYMCTVHICADGHVEARGGYQASPSIILYPTLWSTVSHWAQGSLV